MLSWKGQDGGGRTSEHPCALAGAGEVREGCGAAANYRRCLSCGIDRGSRMGHRPTFPAGSLGNEPGHRGSRLPRLSPWQPRGYLGQRQSRGHRFTSKTPRAGLLNPPSLPPARGTHAWGSVCSHGLLWPTQGRGWPYPDPRVKGCAGSLCGSLRKGLCRDLTVPPKISLPPPRSHRSSAGFWGRDAPLRDAQSPSSQLDPRSLWQQRGHGTSRDSVGC